MNRRTYLGGLGAAGLASLAGCLGLVGMDEHESSPAGVDSSVREETGYEQTAVDDIVVEKEVGASVASDTIVVTNHMTEHEKAVEMGPLGQQRGAVFIVLTTPQIGVAGQNLNPVEDMSAKELVDLVEQNYDDISDITHETDADIEILGQSTTRSRFSADATFNGRDLEVYLHVSEAVEADDDLLVTLGVYPKEAPSGEEDNIIALMEGVATDIDVESESADENGTDESNDEETTDSDGSGDNSDDTDGGDGENGSDGTDGIDGNSTDEEEDDDPL